MAIELNLPPLHADGRKPLLGRAGAWERAVDLNGLASALRVGTDTAQVNDIKSIPDAWAQAQVFQQALLDDGHELHEDVQAQWRGLLALMALQPEFATVYDLETASLRLSDHAGPGHRFRRVLKDLEPRRTLAGGHTSWDDVSLIYFREKAAGSRAFALAKARLPIAIGSPSVLVTPGKRAFEIVNEQVPWLVNGLSDPLHAVGLTSRHYEILAHYIEDIALSLKDEAISSGGRPLLEVLSQRLAQFHGACMARVTSQAPLKTADLGLSWPAPLYSMLNRTRAFDKAAVPKGFSHCRLAIRPEFAKAFEGVVLIDPEMAGPKTRPEDITVWEGYSLRDAMAPATLAKIREDAVGKGWLIVQPSDFFTHQLIRFGEGTDIPAHGRRGFEASLMPLSPLALLLMTPEQLAERAELTVKGAESVASLKLAVLQPDGSPGGKTHTLVRRYGPDATQDEDRPDDLSIWPNFRDPSWRWTFLHFRYDPEYDIQPRFGISAEFITSDIVTTSRSASDRAHRLSEWLNPDGLSADRQLFAERISQTPREPSEASPLLLQRLRFNDTPRVIAEIHRLPRGLEAVFFARRRDGKGTEEPAGLALVKPAPITTSYSDATVSVDFGTTNTVAYTRQGPKLQPVVFEDRLLFPIRLTQKEAEQRENLVPAYTSFFPLKRHETPFPTVSKRREFQGEMPPELQQQLQAGHETHGFSDAIFFVPQFEKFTGVDRYLEWTEKGVLVFNIKWATSETTRRLAKRFLRQVMMMSAAEMAAAGIRPDTLKWRFSYPQAFSRRELSDLQSAVYQAWTELFGGTTEKAKDFIGWETESAAAAHYFMYDSEQAASGAGKLMLMLDVGGGTTDIALWYDEEMRWRNSFRMAGGNFFTKYLANNPEVLRKIDFGQIATSVKESGGELSSYFVELFVNSPNFSTNFDKNFPAFSMEPEGAGLRHCAMVALGGLMHYTGIVLRNLIKEGVVHPRDLEGITVSFAGRGSALFRQFNLGERYDTELSQLCGLAIASAGYEPADVKVDALFSHKPKHEVARGLMADGPGLSNVVSHNLPLGETVAFDGETKGQTAEPQEDAGRLFGASNISELELTELKAFLVGLKKLTGLGIDLEGRNGEALRIIRQRTGAEMRRALRDLTAEDMEDDTQAIEPPFITALRALVDLMNLPIAERNKRLAVSEKLK